MKLWVTRLSANSLQFGGLERCRVWFAPPVWHERWYDMDDMPFGNKMQGCHSAEWQCSKNIGSVSFGKVFGYDEGLNGETEGEMARVLLEALCRHFASNNIMEWKDSEESRQREFIITFDLEINLKRGI